MRSNHLSLEKIIEASENIGVLTQEEQVHIQECKLCSGRLLAADMMGTALKKGAQTDHIIDFNAVDSISDKVFDMIPVDNKKKQRNFSMNFLKAVSGIAAVFLIVFSVFSILKKEKTETAAVEENVSEKDSDTNDISVPEPVESAEFKSTAIEMAQGSVITGEKYSITAKIKATIVHEHENYYSVKKGTVEFKVESGHDFMVNLNNIALVRVLGTIFTVKVENGKSSVSVTEGMVEIIDLERGVSKTLAAGESSLVNRMIRKTQNITQVDEVVAEIVPEIAPETISEPDEPQKKRPVKVYTGKEDKEMVFAMINDLETALKFSNSPLTELRELFGLYRKTGNWGPIMKFWRLKSETVDTKNNPHLKEMHFTACEASIKLNLYDNKVCKRYHARYPDGPDPEGMQDHLKMAW